MSSKEKYNFDHSELENGPIDKRECRDILCCILFVFAMVVMMALFGIGLGEGSPSYLIAPFNSNSPREQCGISKGLEDYPYLYIAVPFKFSYKQTFCVKACPTEYSQDPNTGIY